MDNTFGNEGDNFDDLVVVIDGFCDFYDRISDENLSVFERALTRNESINVITFDSMQRIRDYRDTGLYVRLVRSECGVIVGGGIDDELAAALTGKIYDIPNKYRTKELDGGQATVYSGSKIAYVTLRRN